MNSPPRMCVMLFLAFCLLSTSGHAESINFQQLKDHFNSVVFVHEHGRTGAEAKPLVKWEGPVIVGVSGTFRPENLQELLKVFDRIKRLTGLQVNVDQVQNVLALIRREITAQEMKQRTTQKPNFVITFDKRETLKKKFKAGINCQGNLSGNRNYVIQRAQATIPFDFQPKTSHCIVEETVQLLGLTNDSTILKNSIFNDESDLPNMSVADQILLKALYDKRLRPGMSRAEAAPLIDIVLRDILNKAAERRAQTQGG